MGWRERSEEIDRIKAETQREIIAIKEAGGNVEFLFNYHRYLNELRSSDDKAAVALAGKKFRPRAIQLAAVAAIKDMRTLEKSDLAFDADVSERLTTAARSAYANAAGHFEKEDRSSLPESSPDAATRREKAAANWDRLIESDPNSLISISMFGHEPEQSTPISRMELVKGLGSVLLLIVVAFVAYYVWQGR